MKKLNIQSKLILVLFIITALAACGKSLLDKPPIGTLSPQIMASEAGVQGLLIGAYSLVDGAGASGDGESSAASNWFWGGVASDDAYKGSDPTDFGSAAPLEKWGTSLTPTMDILPAKWKLCYDGIQRSNDVINTLKLATTIPAAEATQITAQARFLRAYFHMELQKVFKMVPYVDETVGPNNTKVDNSKDISPQINADLQFAVSNLPATWAQVGRVNKWAAQALLAKAYMFQHNLSGAYPLLKDIIANGVTSGGSHYALNANFFSNFNPAQKNSAESVFAAQTSVQDGSSVAWGGDPNGNFGDILNFPYTGGPGACCGFYNPTQDLADAFKTDANGLPLLDTYFQGNHVSADWKSASHPLLPKYVGNLDPRIDWTMGRPGINYLDWGVHPGLSWIRNPDNDGTFSPLKNVYAASQKGAFTDVGSAYWAPTELVANNVNLIRFSNVLLWAAECAVDAGDLTAAVGYVNQVRARMQNQAGWVKDGQPGDYNAGAAQWKAGNNADTYNIGLYTSFADKATATKAVQMETRLELAMEGHRHFDLVRWGIAAPVINAFIQREAYMRPLKLGAVFVAGQHEYMPIPQSEMDNMNADGTKRLTQNPGY